MDQNKQLKLTKWLSGWNMGPAVWRPQGKFCDRPWLAPCRQARPDHPMNHGSLAPADSLEQGGTPHHPRLHSLHHHSRKSRPSQATREEEATVHGSRPVEDECTRHGANQEGAIHSPTRLLIHAVIHLENQRSQTIGLLEIMCSMLLCV